jgi:hypothetical protein
MQKKPHLVEARGPCPLKSGPVNIYIHIYVLLIINTGRWQVNKHKVYIKLPVFIRFSKFTSKLKSYDRQSYMHYNQDTCFFAYTCGFQFYSIEFGD